MESRLVPSSQLRLFVSSSCGPCLVKNQRGCFGWERSLNLIIRTLLHCLFRSSLPIIFLAFDSLANFSFSFSLSSVTSVYHFLAAIHYGILIQISVDTIITIRLVTVLSNAGVKLTELFFCLIPFICLFLLSFWTKLNFMLPRIIPRPILLLPEGRFPPY